MHFLMFPTCPEGSLNIIHYKNCNISKIWCYVFEYFVTSEWAWQSQRPLGWPFFTQLIAKRTKIAIKALL